VIPAVAASASAGRTNAGGGLSLLADRAKKRLELIRRRKQGDRDDLPHVQDDEYNDGTVFPPRFSSSRPAPPAKISIPALNVQSDAFFRACQEVHTKVRKRVAEWAPRLVSPLAKTGGGFYGVSPKTVERYYDANNRDKKSKPLGVRDGMSQALEELRLMRTEMEALRQELHEMRKRVLGEEDELGGTGGDGQIDFKKRRKIQKRKRQFDRVAKEVERWAEDLLFRQGGADGVASDNSNHGWTRLECNKMFVDSFNRDDRTSAYVKWMKDSRGPYANAEDSREYPCIKLYSTIDAPLEEVCMYLSQPNNMQEYNDLIVKHKDLEIISPYSKICWGQTPQLLFVKPRQMITFCHHKWLRDGTQVVVNQAWDYDGDEDEEERNRIKKMIDERSPKAFALRGANYISRHPDDPEKTRVCLITHAHPGSDVPQWALRTSVNSLGPIEPFKLFHKINHNVGKHREELQKRCLMLRRVDETEMVSSSAADGSGSAVGGDRGGMTRRPAGLSQMGYACFWPDGGGIIEGGSMPNQQREEQRQQPQNQQASRDDILDTAQSSSAENTPKASYSTDGNTPAAKEEPTANIPEDEKRQEMSQSTNEKQQGDKSPAAATVVAS